MAIKQMKIVADFETTTDPDDVRVWAVCAVDIETAETVFLSNSLDEFLDWLSDKNTVCYFHNLRFDLEFILPNVLKRGFTFSRKHEPKTFDCLISDHGVVYSFTLYFSKETKKYRKVTFYDSYKKLPFRVANISKAFQLKDEKLVIDYDAPRPVGHDLTEEEKAYIVNDCRIVAQALKIQFDQGMKKMTVASDAMHGYKQIITKDQFDYQFPTFPIMLDDDIRKAYKGGFVYVNPKYQGVEISEGEQYDVNSLYPWTMYSCLLPYGYPMYFEGEPEPSAKFPLFIVRLRCSFTIKPGYIPTIQMKKSGWFVSTEYLTSSEGRIVELTLTNVDLKLFLDHYDVLNLEYIKGWRFKGVVGLFKEYIDYWMHIKETNEGPLRQLAKLMLNSL